MTHLSNFETRELLEELKKRGWYTQLIWCRDDVQRQLDYVNEEREERGKEILVLSDEDKDDILESLSYEWHCERLNEEIFEKVWSITEE